MEININFNDLSILKPNELNFDLSNIDLYIKSKIVVNDWFYVFTSRRQLIIFWVYIGGRQEVMT